MLHPDQFQVNEAWIAFRLNDEPIQTEQDGDFDFFVLMDAASCFILSSVPLKAGKVELGEQEVRRLLKEGQAHKEELPKTLFLPKAHPGTALAAEAERLGIDVVRVSEDQLLALIGEAKQGFREHFG
ncbi:hypothetical protein [Halochromatium glycolicum]|uniref:Uncharacterized protein n=1 Tax=Halochromatium glycolicum TaxID=85075 RepID=A0AAJ0U8E9_9GAMM|nr:hypothetical protein [Halochromatium glycolicum]MBK1707132.1 hypothetical protein [Halochromatium glycolicum]